MIFFEAWIAVGYGENLVILLIAVEHLEQPNRPSRYNAARKSMVRHQNENVEGVTVLV
jgi:hypothetical protein